MDKTKEKKDMRRLFPIWVGLILLLLVQGCTKDSGPYYVSPELDTINGYDTVYFALDVVPIFVENCWVCHPPNGGLDLGAINAYANLVNVTSVGFPSEKRVVPYDPLLSLLWKKIIHSGEFGLDMPPNEVLSTEDLLTIRNWIEQGAQNN
jgi:hypothetical protein